MAKCLSEFLLCNSDILIAGESSQAKATMDFDRLPDLVFISIVDKLPIRNQIILCQVSQKWRNLVAVQLGHSLSKLHMCSIFPVDLYIRKEFYSKPLLECLKFFGSVHWK